MESTREEGKAMEAVEHNKWDGITPNCMPTIAHSSLSFLSYLESKYSSDWLKHYVDIGHAHYDSDEDECD